MKVEIKIINVEDGDSVIHMLSDNIKKSLIMIAIEYIKYYPKVKRRLDEVRAIFKPKNGFKIWNIEEQKGGDLRVLRLRIKKLHLYI